MPEVGDRRGDAAGATPDTGRAWRGSPHAACSGSPEFVRFGECYFSEALPGAVKAWKRHREQTQQLTVPVGRVRFVLFDDRMSPPGPVGDSRSSSSAVPTRTPSSAFPPGVWYGFAGVGDGPALIANCADLPHDPSEAENRPADDPGVP